MGATVCIDHQCVCGAVADSRGVHALSCHKIRGRSVRHDSANKLLHRAFNAARFNARLEPTGLCKDDSKRPDGVTHVPWDKGKCLVWDYSCVNTLAATNLAGSLKAAGTAATEAEKRKSAKYRELEGQFVVQPILMESLGTWGPSTRKFISKLGNEIAKVTGEERSTAFLRQSLSIAVQRGNSMCVVNTARVEDENSEWEDEVFTML